MFATVASRGAARAVFLTLLAMLLVAPAGAAFAAESGGAAAEEDHSSPTISEIGSGSKTAAQHLPEEAELPAFQRFLYVPLIIGGFLIVSLLLFRYLQWQPRFAEERRSKRRR